MTPVPGEPRAGSADGPPVARRPRVLVTHPSAELYGSDRMLAESVRGLVEAGAEVAVALPGAGPLAPVLTGAGARVLVVDVPVLRRSALRPAGAVRLLAGAVSGLLRALRLLRAARPDVLHVSTQVQPLWVLAGRLAGVPVVAHVHEAEGAAPRPVRRALAAPLRAAGVILVNSAYAGEGLAEAEPALRGRPIVVPNGVAGPPAGPTALVAPGAGEPVRLIYVGRLSERKGVLVALAALAELLRRGHEATLDLVGDVYAGHADFAERLEAALADGALGDRVTRHGFCVDVWPHLAAGSVLLVPSLLPEPFGNTAVEGVLAGRPVVASATGGLPEALAGCSGSRLVPPGDAAALADAVVDLLADPATAARAAAVDAEVLRRRHDPVGYRLAVAGAVLAAVPAARPAGRTSAPGAS